MSVKKKSDIVYLLEEIVLGEDNNPEFLWITEFRKSNYEFGVSKAIFRKDKMLLYTRVLDSLNYFDLLGQETYLVKYGVDKITYPDSE